MRYLLSLFLVFVIINNTVAKPSLSEKAEISLLTCSPGDELYAIFGHSAIRVSDTVTNVDLVFNYGIFDFQTPFFYLKFANGNLNYMVSPTGYKRFLRQYNYEKRSVWEQKLNLTFTEKKRLFDALMVNIKPENKYYRYDFFFDNCATRIRDIIIESIDGEVIFDKHPDEEKTFRDIIHEYQTHIPWISDGLDILLGMKTDYRANLHNQMFMPDYMMNHFNNAKITSAEGAKPLIKDTKTILSFNNEHLSYSGISPSVLFWGIFVLSLLLLYYEIKKRKKPLILFNRILLFVTGIVGVLIFFLWFLSRHSVTGENFNMLWAFPANILVFFIPIKWYDSKVFKGYIGLLILGILIVVTAGKVLPQFLPSMIFPLSLLLLSRYIYWLYFLIFFKKNLD